MQPYKEFGNDLYNAIINRFHQQRFVETVNNQHTKGCLIVKNPGQGSKIKVGVFDFEGFRGHILVPDVTSALKEMEIHFGCQQCCIMEMPESLFEKWAKKQEWMSQYNKGAIDSSNSC